MLEKYNERDLKNPATIVDANHSNSNKQFKEQIRIVNSKRILENTAFLCRKDNDHFLILPSVYEKLDLDDWLLAHLFFYDKDGKRCIGVELSEVE